jgi:hypothetical protein
MNAMVVKCVFINFKNKIAKNVRVKVYANIIVEELCVMNAVINLKNVFIINIIALIVKTYYAHIINRNLNAKNVILMII